MAVPKKPGKQQLKPQFHDVANPCKPLDKTKKAKN